MEGSEMALIFFIRMRPMSEKNIVLSIPAFSAASSLDRLATMLPTTTVVIAIEIGINARSCII